jgi:hypothetical protein
MKPPNSPTLAPEALYAKSQVYIGRGLKAQDRGDAEEYQLWASLALELLGKTALARVHPALIADPQHYQSLFAACGCQLSPDVRTIAPKTLFGRLGHIDKAFDVCHQKFCEQISQRRNAELHSGESPFSGMRSEAWEREFWGAIEVLLKMQKESLKSWLGIKNAEAPAKIIEQAAEALEWAVKNRIARCREDFEQKYQDPKKRAEILEKSKEFRYWTWPEHPQLTGDVLEKQECPACSAAGMASGALWQEEVSEADYDPDDPGPPVEWVDRTYVVEEFLCSTCGLHLFGTNEIRASGLPEEFKTSDVRERVFGDPYGND